MKKIVVIGGGGHAKVVIDIIKKNGYEPSEIEVLDDNLEVGSDILSCKVAGKVEDVLKYNKDTKFIIAIGINQVREKISKEYDLDYSTFIHPSAVIGEDVIVGKGSVIMGGSVINSGSIIGNHTIINTSVSVDHDSNIDDFVHLSPGVHMGGSVSIGKGTWLGVGTSVKNNVIIGEDIIIGVGSVVVKDINEKGTYVGNPLIKIK
ncbi:acetyltransferase [Anaerofustis stercorihominis]|uniref:acetyltransferase n=1 Tax=Anaerofustis stercorihominis TaxID=214853 RepID=UPI00214CA828|nr:acetyltransferase [Anaerofustis stercorihominis]MCR2032228.1 acetyltransferase [Anaerofustis stercorihominis]